MQVPAYVSLRVIAGCYLQPAFPGRPATHTTEPLSSGSPHIASQAGLEAQVTSPVLATAATWPVSSYLPTAAKPTTGPQVLVHLPEAGPPAQLRRPGAGSGPETPRGQNRGRRCWAATRRE